MKTADPYKVKIELTDEQKEIALKKGIYVTFPLSSAAKITNNRIYTEKGHKAGVSTWTSPYKKPVLVHHDTYSDPIGRFQSSRYVSLEDQARTFFKDEADFTAFKTEVRSGDAKRVKKAFKDWKAITTRKDWPGLGRVEVKVKITDKDAIQKFLDERYLTFSAGQGTDSYSCGECGLDWMAGKACDHYLGDSDEDGFPILFVTGNMKGREGSVVNDPANKDSFVHLIELADSEANVRTDAFDSEYELLDSQIEFDEDPVSVVSDVSEEVTKPVVAVVVDEVKPVAEIQLDWYVLDLALTAAVGNAKVNDEVKEKYNDEIFLGTEKRFPLGTIAYCDAAREILTKANIPSHQKDSLIAKIDARSKSLVADQLQNLKTDYANALALVAEYKTEIDNLKQMLDSRTQSENNIPKIENPSVTHSNLSATTLGKFEKSVIDEFRSLKKTKGKAVADLFLRTKKARGHLSRDFNIDPYIQENE